MSNIELMDALFWIYDPWREAWMILAGILLALSFVLMLREMFRNRILSAGIQASVCVACVGLLGALWMRRQPVSDLAEEAIRAHYTSIFVLMVCAGLALGTVSYLIRRKQGDK